MNRRRLRKLREALPKGDPNGLYLGDEFVTFDELHQTCQELMDPANAPLVESELGKMHYTKDPTYNMRKK